MFSRAKYANSMQVRLVFQESPIVPRDKIVVAQAFATTGRLVATRQHM
jgi:hypothetical protein